MVALLSFLLTLLASPLRSRSRLEAENAALRHQLIVLRSRSLGGRPQVDADLLALIRPISVHNPLWGRHLRAPRFCPKAHKRGEWRVVPVLSENHIRAYR